MSIPPFFERRRAAEVDPARRYSSDALGPSAPVVPMTARRDDDGSAYFQLGAPLRPPDHADPTELLTALLSRHEGPVLDWPEAYDDPLSKWVVPDRESAASPL